MKIKKAKEEFTPITIILETKEEADYIYDLLIMPKDEIPIHYMIGKNCSYPSYLYLTFKEKIKHIYENIR